MQKEENESEATRFLNQHPDLREKIRSSSDFQQWRTGFTEREVDGVKYFVARGKPMEIGGDHLMDEDELMLEYAGRTGLISSDEVQNRSPIDD